MNFSAGAGGKELPRTYGPYTLLTSFGRGGMGEVFLGYKDSVAGLKRLCVVKTLRGDLSTSKEYIGRFLDESRVALQLTHPGISQIYDAGLVGSDHYLAMEFIHGINLRDLLEHLAEQSLSLAPALAMHIMVQVLDALSYAHTLKNPITDAPLRIIHRDVSPANVMLSFQGDVKLIDFGLAESTLKEEQTETKLVMGKVAYMSPEQARGDVIDASADQFAAAVVLYESMTSNRFYDTRNTHEIWQIVGHGGYIPPGFAELTPDVQDVVGRALRKDVADRYPSCAAFRDALDALRVRTAPDANRAALATLMTSLYGDRINEEKAAIARLASAEPPSSDATSPQMFEVKTEPHRASGSLDGAPVLGFGASSHLRAQDATPTSMVPRAKTPLQQAAELSLTESALFRAHVPSQRPRWLAAGAVLAIAALLAGGWWLMREQATVPLVVAAPVDVPVVGDPPTPPVPPPVPVVAPAVVPAIVPAVVPTSKPATVVVEVKKPTPTPTPTPTPEPAPEPAPAPRTFSEELAVLSSCKKPCAKVLREELAREPAKRDFPSFVTLVQHCAAGCSP
jgi:eukaryotic-like serine/threonine-protein kinase